MQTRKPDALQCPQQRLFTQLLEVQMVQHQSLPSARRRTGWAQTTSCREVHNHSPRHQCCIWKPVLQGVGERSATKKQAAKGGGDLLNRGCSAVFPSKRFSKPRGAPLGAGREGARAAPRPTARRHPPPLTAVSSGSPAPCHFAAESPPPQGGGDPLPPWKPSPELAGTVPGVPLRPGRGYLVGEAKKSGGETAAPAATSSAGRQRAKADGDGGEGERRSGELRGARCSRARLWGEGRGTVKCKLCQTRLGLPARREEKEEGEKERSSLDAPAGEGGRAAPLCLGPQPPQAPRAPPAQGGGWQQVLRRSRNRSLHHHHHAGACERRRVHARRGGSRTASSLPLALPRATPQRPRGAGKCLRYTPTPEDPITNPQKPEPPAAATRLSAPSRVRRGQQGPGARRGSGTRRPLLPFSPVRCAPAGGAAGGGRAGERPCRLAPGLSLPSPAPPLPFPSQRRTRLPQPRPAPSAMELHGSAPPTGAETPPTGQAPAPPAANGRRAWVRRSLAGRPVAFFGRGYK